MGSLASNQMADIWKRDP